MMTIAAATFQAGSYEHRQLLARFFLDTHLDYTPEAIRERRLSVYDARLLRARLVPARR